MRSVIIIGMYDNVRCVGQTRDSEFKSRREMQCSAFVSQGRLTRACIGLDTHSRTTAYTRALLHDG